MTLYSRRSCFSPAVSVHPLNSNVCHGYPSHNYSARCKYDRGDMETRYTCSLTYITAKLRILPRRLYIYIYIYIYMYTFVSLFRILGLNPLTTFIRVIRSADCIGSSVRHTHTRAPSRSACPACHCHLDTAPHSHELILVSSWSSTR